MNELNKLKWDITPTLSRATGIGKFQYEVRLIDTFQYGKCWYCFIITPSGLEFSGGCTNQAWGMKFCEDHHGALVDIQNEAHNKGSLHQDL